MLFIQAEPGTLAASSIFPAYVSPLVSPAVPLFHLHVQCPPGRHRSSSFFFLPVIQQIKNPPGLPAFCIRPWDKEVRDSQGNTDLWLSVLASILTALQQEISHANSRISSPHRSKTQKSALNVLPHSFPPHLFYMHRCGRKATFLLPEYPRARKG